MAKGRFLSREISEDEAVAALSNDTARLLFTWMIPHGDVAGRLWGEPRQLMNRVFFMRSDVSEEEVDRYLDEMHALGLIMRYRVEGRRYLYFPSWEKHQVIREDREAPSKFPAPPPHEDAGTIGASPASGPGDDGLTAGVAAAPAPGVAPGVTPAPAPAKGGSDSGEDGEQFQQSANTSLSLSLSLDPPPTARARAYACEAPPPPTPQQGGSEERAVPYAVIDLTNAPASLLRLYLDASGERGNPSPRFRKWFEEVTTRYTRSQCEAVFRQLGEDVEAGRMRGSKWKHTQGLFEALDGGNRTGRTAALARNDPTASSVTATVIEL